MKKFVMLLASAFIVLAAAAYPSTEAKAQNVASVVYDFSSYQVPSGAQSHFEVNPTSMTSLLQKNADGSFALDAAGNFIPDQTAINNFVASLAVMYDVPGQTVLNQAVEVNYLTSLITLGMADPSHVPSVTVSNAPSAVETAQAAAIAASQAPVDTAISEAPAEPQEAAQAEGQTYIDINISTQKLTYYVNGTPSLVSDIVTGNTSRHHDTPLGTYQIYGKQLGRTLRGANYSAYVNYWMPFTGNYGLHDASWRSSFGGTIYQRDGSHGCVNMPKATAAALYATAPVGTVVSIHL